MNILVVGAGTIGATIARWLSAAREYAVTLADGDVAALERHRRPGLQLLRLDAGDEAALAAALAGKDAVVSACPYVCNPAIAAAAAGAGAHYLDLTEDVATTKAVRALAAGADRAFIPQCGLAPGFIAVAAHDLAQRFERLRSLHMRVGALPLYPDNALKYNLTWSTDGLINEYCNPCEAIRDGAPATLMPLEGLERFAFDGIDYEAFNTSGGLGTLCETLAGRVDALDYKTVRYPGHRDVMKLLLQDLRLAHRRALLKDVLEQAVPATAQDVVLISVSATGWRRGRLVQETFAEKIYGAGGDSAIQRTTAAGLCAMLDLLREGRLPQRGFVRQEEARLADVLANRFGRVFAPASPRLGAAA